MRIDLNCDMGESFGVYTLGQDEAVMPLITSANIACGFHAGDPQVMQRTVAMAAQHGVGVGAHVSFRDLVGFGRREMQMEPAALFADLLYQMGALQAFCRVEGANFRHVKAHGALYNMAQRELAVAEVIASAVAAFDPELILFTQPDSALAMAGRAAKLQIANEVFADRAYTQEGRLAGRHLPGSLIKDPALVADRVNQMVVHGTVPTMDGGALKIQADTLCVHGDTPGVVTLLTRIRQRMLDAGVSISPV
jgi:UPF0271 protein